MALKKSRNLLLEGEDVSAPCTYFHTMLPLEHGILYILVMSWGRTEGVPRFYIFGEDSASAYVLRHQTSIVLEFQARDRRGFGGLDDEFEGQSMSISD